VYGFSQVTVTLPILGNVKVWKLDCDGYLFSFFWVLDLASIFSLFFDIDWISTPMGLNLDSSGNTKYAKASQVVRLVRLTRLVRLYRIYTMKRRRQLLKKKIIENAANDGLDVDTELKKLDLYAQRDSKLGILLNDSTTKKLIVLILAILFILPLLTATITNNGPMLMLQTLQYYNKGSSFTIEQKQEIINIMLDQYQSNQVSQYFDNRLTSYLVYLKMSPSFSDLLVYDNDKISEARTRDISQYSIIEDINGITYEVSAKFDDKRLYRDR
jgi:hypothetical protein